MYNVKRLCRSAGVPEVTAHATRGIHATIATQVGTTSHIVAMALGHGNDQVTKRHYIRRGAAEQASRDRFLDRLGSGFEEGSEGWERGKTTPETFPHEERPAGTETTDWPNSPKSLAFPECEGGDSNPPQVAPLDP